MSSNSVPSTTDQTVRAHLAEKLGSFYLEELRSSYTEPRGDASGMTSSSGVSEPTEITTIFGTEAFYADPHVRKIMEHCAKKGIDPIPRLRLLIFIEYKLSKLKVDNKYIKDPEPWFKPAKALRKDLDCHDEGSLLYRSLWPELIMKEPTSESRWYDVKCDETSLTVGGDCMCSLTYVLRDGLELFLRSLPTDNPTLGKAIEGDEAYTRLFNAQKQDARKMGVKYVAPGLGSYLPVILHDMSSGNEYLREIWSDNFLELVQAAFSRANWIIVPTFETIKNKRRSMNQARGSFKGAIHDYWDRTMERVLATERDSDADWEKYRIAFQQLLDREWEVPGKDTRKPGLQALLLNDWVEKKGDRYRPKYLQLCDRKTRSSRKPSDNEKRDNPGPPTTLDQWENMVKDMTDRIRQRRERMKEILLAATED